MEHTVEYKYASPIFGSLARDFGAIPMPGEPAREAPRARPDARPDARPEAAPKTSETPLTRERTKTRTAAVSKQALSPGAVIGFLLAAVLLVFTLFAQIQVTQISDESVGLQKQLAELQTEQTRLQIQYESVFNFTEIESYAMSEFGMQKPRDGQMFYLDNSAPDKVVILGEGSGSGGLLDRLSDMIESLAEYLRGN